MSPTTSSMDPETPKKVRKTPAQQNPDNDLPSPAVVLDAVRQEVLHQVETRPYTTLLVAAGVGYVIGAGAPRWASRLAWTFGSRMVMARILGAAL